MIFIPIFVIHFLFSIYPTNNLWIAKWTAGELLGYFGSILGAVATIISVVITIIYTKHNQNEQNILQVKPYLQSKHTLFYFPDEATEKEYNYATITISRGLSVYNPENNDILNDSNSDSWEKFYKDNSILKYTIKNAGANTATDIKWSLENSCLMYSFALSKDEINEFIIIVNKSALQNHEFNLNFEFNYGDVLSLARYSQKETIKFRELDFGLYFTQTAQDTLSSPKRIK